MQVIEAEPYNVIFTITISWLTFIGQKGQFSLHRMIFQVKFVYLELSSPWKLTLPIIEALQTFPRILFTNISGLCKPSLKIGPSQVVFYVLTHAE